MQSQVPAVLPRGVPGRDRRGVTTVFGFIAQPDTHVFLKAMGTKRAAEEVVPIQRVAAWGEPASGTGLRTDPDVRMDADVILERIEAHPLAGGFVQTLAPLEPLLSR
ncbi:MAG: hypothetical protein M3Q09_03605 [Gemmatimonadota bacterium]|nr:hypothetical protein [Gemmatimonadota bacterium]